MRKDIVEELFAKYYNDALLYTLALSKNKTVAEDVVSDALYKALETADETVTSFKYWLLKVCRNLYLNRLRKEKRHSAMPDELTDETEQVVERIIRDEEYQALYRAIELLPDAQKEVIVLFYFENAKLDGIAQIVGKNTTTVKVTLFRARENLKKILEAKNGF